MCFDARPVVRLLPFIVSASGCVIPMVAPTPLNVRAQAGVGAGSTSGPVASVEVEPAFSQWAACDRVLDAGTALRLQWLPNRDATEPVIGATVHTSPFLSHGVHRWQLRLSGSALGVGDAPWMVLGVSLLFEVNGHAEPAVGDFLVADRDSFAAVALGGVTGGGDLGIGLTASMEYYESFADQRFVTLTGGLSVRIPMMAAAAVLMPVRTSNTAVKRCAPPPPPPPPRLDPAAARAFSCAFADGTHELVRSRNVGTAQHVCGLAAGEPCQCEPVGSDGGPISHAAGSRPRRVPAAPHP